MSLELIKLRKDPIWSWDIEMGYVDKINQQREDRINDIQLLTALRGKSLTERKSTA